VVILTLQFTHKILAFFSQTLASSSTQRLLTISTCLTSRLKLHQNQPFHAFFVVQLLQSSLCPLRELVMQYLLHAIQVAFCKKLAKLVECLVDLGMLLQSSFSSDAIFLRDFRVIESFSSPSLTFHRHKQQQPCPVQIIQTTLTDKTVLPRRSSWLICKMVLCRATDENKVSAERAFAVYKKLPEFKDVCFQQFKECLADHRKAVEKKIPCRMTVKDEVSSVVMSFVTRQGV